MLIATGTVAVAATLTVIGLGALPRWTSPTALVSAAPSLAPNVSAGAVPDALTVLAQSMADQLVHAQPGGRPAAAAFVATTYAQWVASQPDTAGIPAGPRPSDTLIVVSVEGFFPSTHSCYYPSPCFDTGIVHAYDVTLSLDLGISWTQDPWSRDLPSPPPSVSERFKDLSQWGMPILLRTPD